MTEQSIVQDRDYTLIIDKSGSMSISDRPGGKTRWDTAQESTMALARKCEEIDPRWYYSLSIFWSLSPLR